MKTNKIKLLLCLLMIPLISPGQKKLEGKIFDSSDNDELGLPGANVVWAGTTVGTTTNVAGWFSIRRVKESDRLVVSFVGYKTDTITVEPSDEYITHPLSQGTEIAEIIISDRAPGSFINRVDPVLTVNITGAELCKAACCNLSESFETNASVDVNYADAATGAKQIQLLGLAGTYTQILTENIPSVYGLNTAYGLNYIPGPWMESIQISKGTSSVRNGYESMAGQINVEYKKPRTSEKFYLNGFASDAGRKEINANSSVILSSRLSTMLLLHGELQNTTSDHNQDGFRDEPDIVQYNIFNRWDYMTDRFTFRAGIKYLDEERTGGQFTYQPENPDTWTDGFGIKINTRRAEAFTKTGGVFGPNQSMSVGWIQNVAWHSQESFIGRRSYDGTQETYYSNLLFQWNPGPGKHTLDAGLSYKYDLYDEHLDSLSYSRRESVPGIFAQYTYTDSAKMTLIAGIRSDFHNLYGTLITPRVHLRYVINPLLTLRASAGKGFRAGNILAENAFLLASSRRMLITPRPGIEEAWNAGLSLIASIPAGSRTIKLSGEVFRTSFINQIITDMDADINEVRFYDLDGKSYSNVLHLEASTTVIEGFDILAAWRWNDVKMTIDGTLMEKPLTSRYKGLLTASWLTRLRKWQYDYTLQLNGPGRVPSTEANPEEFRRDDEFRPFVLMNAQITRNFKKWNIYLGADNLTNFRQHDPIIDAANPFGDYFDSGLIWGPVHGRKIYGGFRIFFNRDV
ncbi:MAG: TonB-dependent receptor [Bacteroidales bacterium]|nr:TonB-dependent receptor [Bacteroidales bacterium]MBN2632210.1 TonB-dependent receptor [Bacteroidales bacterium]